MFFKFQASDMNKNRHQDKLPILVETFKKFCDGLSLNLTYFKTQFKIHPIQSIQNTIECQLSHLVLFWALKIQQGTYQGTNK